MSTRVTIVFLLLLISRFAIGNVQVQSEPLPFGKRIVFSSTFLKSDEVIDIYLPNGFELDSTTTRYPVIVTMDGWTLSQSISGITAHLSNTAALPKSIVVSLNTDVWPLLPRSYVHSTDNWPYDETTGLVYAFQNNDANAAQPFWRFLRDELMPYLETHYRANQFRTFVGMSPTAYMGIHTMLNQPDLFDAYILMASTDLLGLGYTKQESLVDKVLATAKLGTLNNKYIYIASAAFEARREPRHLANAERLSKGLSAFATQITYNIEHIEHFGHYPVVIPAFTNAMNLVFPRQEHQQFKGMNLTDGQALTKIKAHYANLSRRYGVTISIPTNIKRNPNSLRSLGNRLMRLKDYEQAEAAFSLWSKIADKDPDAYYWLSQVASKKGERERALSHIKHAIELSKSGPLSARAQYEQALFQYQALEH